ncbi:MAG: DUF5666 domain-containing protein [Acidobacteriota bacterium]|nr:DUF5666 domain-containing protein [Acidobacteriota bacterium]
MTGTVTDIQESRNRLVLQTDDAAQTTYTIEADTVSTTYHGFGTVIAGKAEVFVGAQGFSNVRLGDRLEVRGPMRSAGLYGAQRVTLLGRAVAAAPVGVGQTRDPQVHTSTPTDARTTTATGGFVEGTIRQINDREGRLVVQTTAGRMVSVRTLRNTPVYFRGERYQVANLEVGDRVRIQADPRDAAADDITATRIDVTTSVQETGTVPQSGGNVTMLEGRVTRVEPGLDYVYVDTGRGETRVDMRQAEDARGEVLRARDVRVGDRVSIAGSYNRVGDMFLASTVRFGGDVGGTTGGTGGGVMDGPMRPDDMPVRFSLVTLTGTVTETLEEGGTIGFRDRNTNATLRIWASEDLVMRNKAGGYATADTLRVNDTVVIQAFRDAGGNLVAQTVRLRNR